MRISDWSSDVCSSDLIGSAEADRAAHFRVYSESVRNLGTPVFPRSLFDAVLDAFGSDADILTVCKEGRPVASVLNLYHRGAVLPYWGRSEEHTSELQSLMRISYAVFCLKKKKMSTYNKIDINRHQSKKTYNNKQ